jgi:hypothetical protein
VSLKTKTAERTVPLPVFAVAKLRAHRREQAARRLALGSDWRDLDLVCERGDGQPMDPDSFSAGFRRIAENAGLPC